MNTGGQPSAWSRISIERIEDLSDAVYGAGLQATQMASGEVTGSLAFTDDDSVVISSGLMGGQVALSGPLSMDKITIGIGLRITPGSWHWLKDVETGVVGVFRPGDEHDSFYMPGSLYATMTLSAERLEREAAKEDLVLDQKTLGGSAIHARKAPPRVVSQLRRQFERIHRGGPVAGEDSIREAMLRALIRHYARQPHPPARRPPPVGRARIVARARDYIMDHLCERMALDDIASAACTSRRTLQRAFIEYLGETPQSFVRRLRLHRIRHDLACDAEKACSIALISNQWGMSELGRMSGWYRELFGELPRDTVVHPPESRRPALDHC